MVNMVIKILLGTITIPTRNMLAKSMATIRTTNAVTLLFKK